MARLSPLRTLGWSWVARTFTSANSAATKKPLSRMNSPAMVSPITWGRISCRGSRRAHRERETWNTRLSFLQVLVSSEVAHDAPDVGARLRERDALDEHVEVHARRTGNPARDRLLTRIVCSDRERQLAAPKAPEVMKIV